MRSSTDASLTPWPMRILRPWLVASAAGLSIGMLLLAMTPEPQAETNSYVESAPRAAVFDPRPEASLSADPFAPAASLASPPDAPALAIPGADAIAPVPATVPAGTAPAP